MFEIYKEIEDNGAAVDIDLVIKKIEDYIKVINSYPIKRKIAKLNQELKEETNPIKQANILSEILSLKGVK